MSRVASDPDMFDLWDEAASLSLVDQHLLDSSAVAYTPMKGFVGLLEFNLPHDSGPTLSQIEEEYFEFAQAYYISMARK